ncbi:HNH endonuclease signature motif containing protein [Mycolicibacterium fortuitum]|uniref:HNH endonuclease signature motif containing protein n=1 Tax=Mycolicibacterium fortuitum TaxID=1766 RepID=UPI0034CE4FE6
MTDRIRKRGKRCEPGCKCGRHMQKRWPDLSPEARFWTKVDKSGEHWLWTGAKAEAAGGHGMFWIDGKHVKAHRFSFELAKGPIPPELVIDHNFDCPKHCVNPDHLRLATRKQNSENRSGTKSSTGFRGVFRQKSGNYSAYVNHGDKRYHAGTFGTAEEAARAAIAKRNELYSNNQADWVESED